MIHVDTITLEAGLIQDELWLALLDKERNLVAACPPFAVAVAGWTPYHDVLNVEAFQPAENWLRDSTHFLHIAMNEIPGQNPTKILAAANAYVDRTVATTYEGGTVEVLNSAFKILARSQTPLRAAARTGSPRPKTHNRIDVWI